MKFEELGLHEGLLAGIRDAGFDALTPIQEGSIPPAILGSDVTGQAQTGTGKTAAFLIATYQRLHASDRQVARQEGCSLPRALVLAPTRELVVQIEKDAAVLGAHTGLNTLCVFGGVDYEKQRKQLEAGDIDVLVGTPGRLMDYLKQRVYDLKQLQVLIIDEADRMFDLGFIDDLKWLFSKMPGPDRRQTLLFSATMGFNSRELARRFMNEPVFVSATPDQMTAEKVRQALYHIGSREKIPFLLGWLKRMGEQATRIMIFINTKRMGEKLQDYLAANGYESGYLSGDVRQTKRLSVLSRFQEGKLPILIATDVASRGLHIDGVTHVVNFDLPLDPEDYVHRIGRTARAGTEGDALTFCDEYTAENLPAVEKYIGMKIPVEWFEEAELVTPIEPPRSARKPKESSGRDGGKGRGGRSERGERGGRRRSEQPSEAAPQADEKVVVAQVAPPVPAPEAATAVEGEGVKPKRRRRRRKPADAGQVEGGGESVAPVVEAVVAASAQPVAAPVEPSASETQPEPSKPKRPAARKRPAVASAQKGEAKIDSAQAVPAQEGGGVLKAGSVLKALFSESNEG
ncbi:MAG: RNA helicase [Alphaproteobacteria bacterium CG_4_10_14_0_2_um_filter_63_37]|nr:MAG: hypothetical protein AUJ55_12535 [Proteobacteria bacterium CG1_02_64_396]PJA25040.1 MAG: RNA helicase [Alphaproteobacteria bacterium CG_4_10_14_0_2_um_filter_63_37]